jgi:hypothetical protein
MIQTVPILYVPGSPASGQLTLQYRTNTDTTDYEAFLADLKLGTYSSTGLVLYQENEPESANYQPGPAISLRGLTYLAEHRWVDYAALDDIDFDTGTVTPLQEKDRWLAEITEGYVDITVQVHETDWEKVRHLIESNSNVHLSARTGAL